VKVADRKITSMAEYNTSDFHFTQGILHHTLCGMILELTHYVSNHHDTPRPVKLDVSVLEGTVGKLKRTVQEQGSNRIRDWCIRAKLCASETYLDVLSVVSEPLEQLISQTVERNIESVQDRNDRLGTMKLMLFKEREAARAKREAYARAREELLSRVTMRFDCDETWIKKLLNEQAEGRKIKYAQTTLKDDLIEKINQHDSTLDSATLCEQLRARGLEGSAATRPAALWRRLVAYDRKQPHPDSVREQQEPVDDSDTHVDSDTDTESDDEEVENTRKRKRTS
jgi:hypothetical protein